MLAHDSTGSYIWVRYLALLTAEAIDSETAKVIRRARNRLRAAGPRFRDVQVPHDPRFVSYLSRPNGVACWFSEIREPPQHVIAQRFESTFEPGEERAAAIAAALRVW